MNISASQFNSAYKQLPFTLREYIADAEMVSIIEEIAKKYELHVDTTGALHRETTNMLLGLENPTQFMGELKSVGVPQENIGSIIQELNEKIFMPLREKMQKEGDRDPYKENEAVTEKIEKELGITPPEKPTVQAAPSVPQTPVVPPPTLSPLSPATYPGISATTLTNAASPNYAPPLPIPEPGAYSYTPPSAVTPPSIVMPKAPASTTPPVYVPPPAPYQVTPLETKPHIRTMAQDMAQVKAGHYHQNVAASPSVSEQRTAPLIHQQSYRPAPPQVAAPPITTMPSPVSTPGVTIGSVSVPTERVALPVFTAALPSIPSYTPIVSVAPPPPAVGVSLPSSVPQSQPVIAPAVHTPLSSTPKSTPRSANQQQLHEVLKEYGVDPYREPVE